MKPPLPSTATAARAPAQGSPTIGVALGGGGARGLGHIAMLEVFDDLGIRPKVMAGTSIGAIYGAAYASGIAAKDLRSHTREILSQRFGLVRDLFAARSQPFQRIAGLFGQRSSILEPEALLELIMPKAVKQTFAALPIPLKIVATDFYRQESVIFAEGPLRKAVAASMALPVIFQPVMHEGRALIDGGLTNPLPYDLLTKEADIVVAIDVSGVPVPDPNRPFPAAFESLFATAFIFERTIIKEKLNFNQPDILIRAGTNQYQLLDIFKFEEILAAAEPAKERLKQQLDRVLSVETLEPNVAAAERPGNAIEAKRKGLLARTRRRADAP